MLAVASPRRSEAQGSADRVATAQGLYESAAELIKAGRFAAACPKLEESQRLDPAMGTQFFLATCYESTDRPTSAWSLFLEVANAAKASGKALREATATQRAAALEPRLPRITVVVAEANAGLPGLAVSRGDTPLKPVVWGSPIPVDFGAHTVRAAATGKVPWDATVSVRELGQRVEVRVPPLLDASPPVGQEPGAGDGADPPARASTTQDASQRFPAQRVAALVVGITGAAGLVAGGSLGLLARSAWLQADAACPAHTACSPAAHEESARAVSLAMGSTIAFAVSGAAVTAGLVTWFTTTVRGPSARVRLTPAAAGALGAFLTGDL